MLGAQTGPHSSKNYDNILIKARQSPKPSLHSCTDGKEHLISTHGGGEY